MLRLSPAAAGLEPGMRFALDVLIDLSLVLVIDDPDVDVVTLDVDPSPNASTVSLSDGKVTVGYPLLARVLAAAGAGEESRSSARDRYGRVPSSANPLVEASAERRPGINEAAQALLGKIRDAAGRRCFRTVAPWPDGKRWAAAFTHDVDVVTGWPAFTALRLVELARKGQLRRAGQVGAAALGATFGDPAMQGMLDVLAREREAGVHSTWFLLCGTPTLATWRAGDLTYVPESRRVRQLLDVLAKDGHEVGLHGSFATYENADVFAEQRRRLSALGATPTGVRQHYLRMRPGPTQIAMRQAGFTYDATFGFPDRNGFRLGVADIVPSRAAEGLDEVPLVWMDRALSKYRGIEDPNAWVDDALDLAKAAHEVNGLWVGLWHCNLTPPLGYPEAPEAYGRLLTEITRQEPYIAPLDRLVAWRRARRSVRARTVAPDGRVELTDAAIRIE